MFVKRNTSSTNRNFDINKNLIIKTWVVAILLNPWEMFFLLSSLSFFLICVTCARKDMTMWNLVFLLFWISWFWVGVFLPLQKFLWQNVLKMSSAPEPGCRVSLLALSHILSPRESELNA